jgi:photoactive yellow protein
MSDAHPRPLPAEPAPGVQPQTPAIAFDSPEMIGWLDNAGAEPLDTLPFGVIGLRADCTVALYNATESRLAGLAPPRVLGRNFFTTVAPCMNNFMVAHRYQTEAELDAVIDYVLTFRMAPVRVRLRLLKRPCAKLMYVLIERRVT